MGEESFRVEPDAALLARCSISAKSVGAVTALVDVSIKARSRG